jgi:hypothetical protein
MAKAHAFAPLTEQQEQVDQVLLQHGVTHLTHVVFPVRNRMYVVDFFLSGQRTIPECWQSTSRRGLALAWIERNAAYVDLKFRRIKEAYQDVRCIALVEVERAEPLAVREYVGLAMEHADAVCYSVEEMVGVVRRLCEVND